MSSFVKSTMLGLGLVAGVAISAGAQTLPNQSGVAALPPQASAPAPSIGPAAAPPSEKYVGPAPGASDGGMPQHFQKPADWDANVGLHPYTSGMGPKPN